MHFIHPITIEEIPNSNLHGIRHERPMAPRCFGNTQLPWGAVGRDCSAEAPSACPSNTWEAWCIFVNAVRTEAVDPCNGPDLYPPSARPFSTTPREHPTSTSNSDPGNGKLQIDRRCHHRFAFGGPVSPKTHVYIQSCLKWGTASITSRTTVPGSRD